MGKIKQGTLPGFHFHGLKLYTVNIIIIKHFYLTHYVCMNVFRGIL